MEVHGGRKVRNKKFCCEMLSLRYLLSAHGELLSWQVAIPTRQRRARNWRHKFENPERTGNTQSQRVLRVPSVCNVVKDKDIAQNPGTP